MAAALEDAMTTPVKGDVVTMTKDGYGKKFASEEAPDAVFLACGAE